MVVDTGAAVSLVSEETYDRMWLQKSLKQATTVLRIYPGEQLRVCGCVNVEVIHVHQQLTLPLFIINGNGSNL